MSSHADSALVHAVLAGEVPRFGELVARYDAKVRAVVGRLLADPELAARLGAAARETILAGYTVEHMTDRLLAALAV